MESVEITTINEKIFTIRGAQVMLDCDLAELYGVETKVLNQAVKRNSDRFPEEFMFQLKKAESMHLKSQFVTSRFTHGGRRTLPYVFTEQGVAMLSAVLKSKTAINMSIQIMKAFVAMRKMLFEHKELVHKVSELEHKLSDHDASIIAIIKVIKDLALPVAQEPKRRIGFH